MGPCQGYPSRRCALPPAWHRLLAKQGHLDEARAPLADIFNWFTEGLDNPDPKEAKALLEELGA